MSATLTILGMAVFSFGIKALVFILGDRIAFSPTAKMALGFLLTDETYAVVDSYYRKHPDTRLGHWYFLGSGVAMYANWQCWTLIGLAFGAVFPQLQNLGLDFAMVVTFIAIVVPQLVRVPQLAAAVAAGCVAYALKDAPYKLGLMAAVGVGVVVGLVTTRLRGQAMSNRNTA